MKAFSSTNDKLESLYSDLVQKSWKDPIFKEKLVQNPISTIEREFGHRFSLPENQKLLVEDQSNPNVIYLNIPMKVNLEDLELSEGQLEAISGGGAFYDFGRYVAKCIIEAGMSGGGYYYY